MELAALPRPKQVQEPKQNRQSHGDRNRRQFRPEDAEVRAHADEREGRLEVEGKPSAQPADGADQRTQAAIEEIVRASRSWHRSGQFRNAEHRRNQWNGGNQVTQHHRWPRLPKRNSGKQEGILH